MPPHKTLPHARFLAFLAVFVLTALATFPVLRLEQAAILAFDLAALVFILGCVPLYRDDGADAARARAARDDGGRVLLSISAASVIAALLLALGRLIEGRNNLTGLDFAMVTGTLVLAWAFINLLYAFHYSHLYYTQLGAHDGGGKDAGGILFPEAEAPVFADFVYFAFVIGMTSQTADLDISRRAIRRVVTFHGMVTFFFNLGVLALTINVLSGVL
ncbi:MAG: DUF1345 domain-containing protein [Rhodobacteraceae bacterium]|nr:DUF1345 domain-containing protein [Paracoccaceae bacterium]